VVTSDGSFNLAAAVDAGDIVTATATAPDGSTSEFSGCFTVTEPPIDGPSWTVNTSDDHDDSACTLLDCTLREAINRANDETGTDPISFAIAGAGVHTITPATALPVITDPVVIDGSTQPGYSGTPLIELDGTQASLAGGIVGATGLEISAGSSTIRA